jgi:hypothetical protein
MGFRGADSVAVAQGVVRRAACDPEDTEVEQLGNDIRSIVRHAVEELEALEAITNMVIQSERVSARPILAKLSTSAD